MKTYVTSSKAFREAFLNQLRFIPFNEKHCLLYRDTHCPQKGSYLLYERPQCYTFGVADYTIPSPFTIHFDNNERLVRFGTVYKGTTQFQLESKPTASFKPSSFFVVEKNLKGYQTWESGQHFHGAEITIHEHYFTHVINPLLGKAFNFDLFIENHTYHYLPLEVVSILQTMQTLSNKNVLDALYLESCVLQCIAILLQTATSTSNHTFTSQIDYGKIKIGRDRYLHLTARDIQSIQKAHDVLSQNIQSPPTIEKLSQLVLLNPQKLKAGFYHYYHLSIGDFIISSRMTLAANLLATTDKSIAEIAFETGYNYPSNFIKKFRQTYECTPLQYRHNSHL